VGIDRALYHQSPGWLAGPRLPVGSSGDAGCPLGGSRAVMRRMLLEL